MENRGDGNGDSNARVEGNQADGGRAAFKLIAEKTKHFDYKF